MLGLYIWPFWFQGPIGLDGKPVSGPALRGGLLPLTAGQ